MNLKNSLLKIFFIDFYYYNKSNLAHNLKEITQYLKNSFF